MFFSSFSHHFFGSFFGHIFYIFSLIFDFLIFGRTLPDTYSTAGFMWFAYMHPFPKTCFFMKIIFELV